MTQKVSDQAYPPLSGVRPRPKDEQLFELVRKLRAENRELRAENARLRVHVSRSLVDPVTGVCSRRYFDRRLQQEMNRADRFEQPLSLVIVDITDLRTIEHQAGLEEAERVARWVADLIGRTCRECDVPCRISEDEFAVMLPNTDFDGAERVVERLAEMTRSGGNAPILPNGLQVGLSLGVASYPEQVETLLELVFQAEESVLEARTEGPTSERCVVAA